MATLQELVNKFGLTVLTDPASLIAKEVTAGYSSDMLSDVMANAPSKSIWVTMQIHQNIIAVAVLRSISAILLVNGRKPEEETLEKAEKEGITLLSTQQTAFEIVGKLFEAGIRGVAE